MRVGLGAALAAAGCYAAIAPDEVPCASNGSCPAGQQCDTARSPPTCVGEPGDGSGDGPQPTGPDALGPWGPPVPVRYAPTGEDDDDVTLTADMLELYFNRTDDIYALVRPARDAPWSAPVLVGELSTIDRESTPELSPDGLAIFFSSSRPGSAGTDVWVATRGARDAPWGVPELAIGLNSAFTDRCAAPTADPDLIVLASDRDTDDLDLYVATRTAGAWSPPVAIAGTNTLSDSDSAPFLSRDRRTIYFFSDREGDNDLYRASRADPSAPFSPAVPIRELRSDGEETDPWVSLDERHLFFVRDHVLYESVR